MLQVYSMADRLKFYDPVMEKALDENNGPNNVEDQKWLQELRTVVEQISVSDELRLLLTKNI